VWPPYCWAKLHREGEQGLAEGLELLAGLLERFGHNCTRSVTAAVRRRWNGWQDRA
jgi:predicted component of type VI protein secretion system